MKDLTLWQPWATLVVYEVKPFEFRKYPAPKWIVGERINRVGILGTLLALAGVVVLHMAWRENWGGIQQVAAKVAQWFADTWSEVVGFVKGLFGDMVDGLAGTMKAGLSVMAAAADAFGQKDLARAIRGSLGVVDAIAADLKSGAAVKRIAVAALDLGKAAGLAAAAWWSTRTAASSTPRARTTTAPTASPIPSPPVASPRRRPSTSPSARSSPSARKGRA